MKYYVLTIDSGVEAEIRGPFVTADARDLEARALVQSEDFNHDYDSIFRLDVANDVPEAYSYSDDEIYDGALG